VQIILVSQRFPSTRTVNIEARHIIAASACFLLLVLGCAFLFSWLSVAWRLPHVEAQMVRVQDEETIERERQSQEIFRTLSASIGQLQAKMVQLDGLARRLSTQTGVQIPTQQDIANSIDDSPQGGPFVPAPLNHASLREEIDQLAMQIQERGIVFGMLESTLRERMVRRELLPSVLPVRGDARFGSPFGPRVDPFGRGRAIHEGQDFIAPFGSDILAAADGVVVSAAFHPEFGNMVEINHGGELITRYAHMSALKASVGDVVRRGQVIGALGSTGRSTGPHLHFEVRANNIPINPARFLQP
jgi:murein DD-endopeptidase MepM/ murein hydrolase activator NlpD